MSEKPLRRGYIVTVHHKTEYRSDQLFVPATTRLGSAKSRAVRGAEALTGERGVWKATDVREIEYRDVEGGER